MKVQKPNKHRHPGLYVRLQQQGHLRLPQLLQIRRHPHAREARQKGVLQLHPDGPEVRRPDVLRVQHYPQPNPNLQPI